MQPIINILIAISFVASMLTSPASAAGYIDVRVDGTSIPYYGVNAQIIDGRTMVPMRAVCDALYASVTWDDQRKAAIVKKADTTLIMQAGNRTYMVDSIPYTMDCTPVIVNDRMLLPARYVAENLGYQVEWDASTNTVQIDSNSGRNPSYLADFSVEFDKAEKCYSVYLGFFDENKRYMRCQGTASIRIVNDDGEEVYRNVFDIEEGSFSEYTRKLTGNTVYLLTQINIPQQDITASMSQYGNLYMDFFTQDGNFGEQSKMVFDLPIRSGKDLADIAYETSFEVDQDRISYIHKIWVDKFEITNVEKLYGDKIKASYTLEGEMSDGTVCCIKVNCYDKDGYLIDSDMIGGDVDDDCSFKFKDWLMISKDTVRLEFVAP